MQFNTSYIGLRDDLIQYIHGTNKRILDIGCATGVNGHYLKDKKIAALVVGIEIDSDMAAQAKNFLDDVIIGNIEDINILDKIEERKFDYILIGDVLEHLKDPWSLINRLAIMLDINGKFIISVPNIQHVELFISVYINGIWPHNNRGIFDRTHLRWFTYKNILQLEERCNIKIEKIDRIFRYRDSLESKFPFYGKLLKKFFPNLFTFQYVVVAKI